MNPTRLFFNSYQEVFHPTPESTKAANWRGKKKQQPKQPTLKPGRTIHLCLFTSSGRVTHLFPALFTTSIFQPVHDTKQLLLAQELISAAGIVALFSDGATCHLSCSSWWSFPDGFQYCWRAWDQRGTMRSQGCRVRAWMVAKVFQEGTGRHRVHERDLWPDVTLGGECVGSGQRPGKWSGEERSIRSSLKAKKSFLFKYNMEKKSDPPFLLGGRLYNAVKCLNYCLIHLTAVK